MFLITVTNWKYCYCLPLKCRSFHQTSGIQGLITPVQMRPEPPTHLWCSSLSSVWKSPAAAVILNRRGPFVSARPHWVDKDESAINGCRVHAATDPADIALVLSCRSRSASAALFIAGDTLDCVREQRRWLLSCICVQCSGMKDGSWWTHCLSEETASLIQQMHLLRLLGCRDVPFFNSLNSQCVCWGKKCG